jgi:hypothetical protein
MPAAVPEGAVSVQDQRDTEGLIWPGPTPPGSPGTTGSGTSTAVRWSRYFARSRAGGVRAGCPYDNEGKSVSAVASRPEHGSSTLIAAARRYCRAWLLQRHTGHLTIQRRRLSPRCRVRAPSSRSSDARSREPPAGHRSGTGVSWVCAAAQARPLSRRSPHARAGDDGARDIVSGVSSPGLAGGVGSGHRRGLT